MQHRGGTQGEHGREKAPSPAQTATVLVDLLAVNTSIIARPRQAQCPLCGEQPRIREIEATEYEQRQAWEVSLSEFRAHCPSGTIIDVRQADDRPDQGAAQVDWRLVSATDRDWFMALDFPGDTLLVCQVGWQTRGLVQELRDGGNDRVWSLWGGVDGL